MTSIAEILAAKRKAEKEEAEKEAAEQQKWDELYTIDGYLKGQKLPTGFPLDLMLLFYDLVPDRVRPFDGDFYYLDALCHWLGPFDYKETQTRKVPASQWNWGLSRIATVTGIPPETIYAVNYKRLIEPIKQSSSN